MVLMMWKWESYTGFFPGKIIIIFIKKCYSEVKRLPQTHRNKITKMICFRERPVLDFGIQMPPPVHCESRARWLQQPPKNTAKGMICVLEWGGFFPLTGYVETSPRTPHRRRGAVELRTGAAERWDSPRRLGPRATPPRRRFRFSRVGLRAPPPPSKSAGGNRRKFIEIHGKSMKP